MGSGENKVQEDDSFLTLERHNVIASHWVPFLFLSATPVEVTRETGMVVSLLLLMEEGPWTPGQRPYVSCTKPISRIHFILCACPRPRFWP